MLYMQEFLELKLKYYPSDNYINFSAEKTSNGYAYRMYSNMPEPFISKSDDLELCFSDYEQKLNKSSKID